MLRRKAFKVGARQIMGCVVVALLGTVVPGVASYAALEHLPSGVISILLSFVPMMAFPVAVLLGNENFQWSRLVGVVIGLCAVMLIVLPEASLPDRAAVLYIPIALIAPLCYAVEGNYVARWGSGGLDPIQLLFGASAIAAVISGPLALWQGQFVNPLGRYDAATGAMVASSVIHGFIYSAYVWLVGRAGPVFAVQVSYLVTAFGVIWAMWLLDERYSLWVWAAFAILLIGLTLVQPRAPKQTDLTES